MAARSDSVGPDSVLEEELDVLRAIYIHELVVEASENNERPTVVFLTLHPATGDDVTQQFVCMTVVFKLPNTYPDDVPEITIKNPRGLAEEEVQRLQKDMIELAEERCGGAMLFELIEMAKEILTEGNIPRCPCVVCMEHFHEGDLFTRTECYHYYHQACLKRYIEHALTFEPEVKVMHLNQEEKEPKVVCPVCREEITFDLEELQQAPPLDDKNLVYKPSESMIKMQREMADHYARQKAIGGIIDLEAEKNKYLVNEETVVVMTQVIKSEEKPQKKEEEKSERKRNPQNKDTVVAKYRGPPRRNRNTGYQGRSSPYEEKDHPKGDNSSHVRNDRRETDRYRGGNRQGDRRWRQGTDRNQQDYRNDDRDRKSEKKDAFDHREMKKEVENIQYSRKNGGRQDYHRRHERNTNNSCTDEKQDLSQSVELSNSLIDGNEGVKDQETLQKSKQDKSGKSVEDWESERTVVNSPDKQLSKELSDSVMTPREEVSKIKRDSETKTGKNYDDRWTNKTRQISESKMSVEELSRHSEREDRRGEKSYSQRGRRDWGRQRGGRERRDGFQSQRHRDHHGDRPQTRSSENWDEESVPFENSSKGRNSGRRDDRNYRTSSKSENWDAETAPFENSSKGRNSGRRDDRNYRTSSKSENWDEEKHEEERKGGNSFRGKTTITHKGAKSENWEAECIPVEDKEKDTYASDRGHGRGKRGHGRGRGQRSDKRWQEGDKPSEDMNARQDFKSNRRNRGSNYRRQNENSSVLNGETNNSNSERFTKSSHKPGNKETFSADVPPPPGFKAPQIEVKGQPSSKKCSPPGIKVPPPDHSTQSVGSTSSSPGIRITGPPPGFNAKTQDESSRSGVSPPPGFR